MASPDASFYRSLVRTSRPAVLVRADDHVGEAPSQAEASSAPNAAHRTPQPQLRGQRGVPQGAQCTKHGKVQRAPAIHGFATRIGRCRRRCWASPLCLSLVLPSEFLEFGRRDAVPQTATTNPSSDTGASVSVLYSAPDPDTDRATRPSPRAYRKRPWFPWLRPNLTATLD